MWFNLCSTVSNSTVNKHYGFTNSFKWFIFNPNTTARAKATDKEVSSGYCKLVCRHLCVCVVGWKMLHFIKGLQLCIQILSLDFNSSAWVREARLKETVMLHVCNYIFTSIDTQTYCMVLQAPWEESLMRRIVIEHFWRVQFQIIVMCSTFRN